MHTFLLIAFMTLCKRCVLMISDLLAIYIVICIGVRIPCNCQFVNLLIFASSSSFLSMRKMMSLNSQLPKTKEHVEHLSHDSTSCAKWSINNNYWASGLHSKGSTTPTTAMGRMPASFTSYYYLKQKIKHCRKPRCCNGVVNHLGLHLICLYDAVIQHYDL